VTGELNGLKNSDDTATTTTSLVGIDGSRSLLTANVDSITRATFGITAQTKSGIFFGAGVSWNVPTEARDLRFAEDGKDVVGDYYDWQFRIGYHPGRPGLRAAGAAAAALRRRRASAAGTRPDGARGRPIRPSVEVGPDRRR
jgi:hypothetical protein